MKLRLTLIINCLLFIHSISFSQISKDSLVKSSIEGFTYSVQKKYIHPKYDSLIKEYQIVRIKKIENAYIIDIKDNENYRFTIVSLNCENQKRKKIRKGKKYNLLLYSYYDPKIIYVGDPIFRRIIIDGIYVSFQEDFKTGGIVKTPSLKGLYYMDCLIKQ